MLGRRRKDEVHRITGAAASLTDDVGSREKRYLVSMGIRTACLLLAIVVSGPLRWVLVALAIVLPYVSVVFANAGRETVRTTPDVVVPESHPQLERGPVGRADPRP